MPRPALGLDLTSMATFAKLAQIENNIDPEILGGPLKYNASQLAEAAGVPVELVENFVRWLGRPPIDPTEVRYTDSDVAAMKYAMKFVAEEGLDEDAAGSMIRSAAAGLERLAMRQVESIIQEIARSQNVTDTEARLIAGELAPKQAAKVLPLVDHIWKRQYADSVRRLTTTAIAQRGLNGDDRDYPLLRAVGFADLVGFTARMKDVSAREFSELIRDFSDQCWDIVNSRGGRIVSFIGDAVFFVADDIQTGAEVALGLAEQGKTGICGPVRVGLVWTRVLAAHGDVFGPGVNLASRITGASEPNEVYIGPAAAARLAHNPDYDIVPQQPFDARGIGLVQPYRIRYIDDPRNNDDAEAAGVDNFDPHPPSADREDHSPIQ